MPTPEAAPATIAAGETTAASTATRTVGAPNAATAAPGTPPATKQHTSLEPGLSRTSAIVFAVVLVLITAEFSLGAGVLSARLGGRQSGGAPAAAMQHVDLSDGVLTPGDTAAIRELLGRRASALRRREREAFLTDVDARGQAFRARQAELFDNLQGVPIMTWGYAVRPASAVPAGATLPRRYGADVWISEVDLSYTLTGMDSRPVVARQYLTFVRRAARWFVGGDDDVAAAGMHSVRGPWDFAPVAVTRTPHGLVLARRADAALAAQVSADLETAVLRVAAAWQGWRPRAVVMLAGSAAEVRAMVPGESDLSQIAAITAAELGDRGAPLGERVVINPVAFEALDRTMRQVTLQHEVVHLATSATTSASTPTWLAEGFADEIGYRGHPAQPGTVARDLAADIKSGRPLVELPSEGEFEPDNPRLASVYEASWLACRFIAERIGEDGLARFYRTVSGGPGDAEASLDSGVRSLLGMTSAEFTAQFRAYVRVELGPADGS